MFKKGDIVKIVRCDIHPEMVGKIGRFTKVYSPYHGDAATLYRVNVRGKMLSGVAMDEDLSLISSGENNE